MNAVILAGGRGVRLRPLTDYVPKPMLPIANRPIIDYALDAIVGSGINDVCVTLGYLPELIIPTLTARANLATHLSVETQPLGTLGGILQLREHLDDEFLVYSGDAISDLDIGAMYRHHRQSGALLTMATTTVDDPSRYGVVVADRDGLVKSFCEKPSAGSALSRCINCGIYIVNRSLLDHVPSGNYDFGRGLFPLMLERGLPISTYYHHGYWCDIGDIDSYFLANFRQSGSDCIIGKDCKIASDARLHRCIVMDGTVVNASHDHCILIGDQIVKVRPWILQK